MFVFHRDKVRWLSEVYSFPGNCTFKVQKLFPFPLLLLLSLSFYHQFTLILKPVNYINNPIISYPPLIVHWHRGKLNQIVQNAFPLKGWTGSPIAQCLEQGYGCLMPRLPITAGERPICVPHINYVTLEIWLKFHILQLPDIYHENDDSDSTYFQGYCDIIKKSYCRALRTILSHGKGTASLEQTQNKALWLLRHQICLYEI